jgi:hypothetical protein
VIACTVLPRGTSTDGWTTAANQTPGAYESVRTNLNTWLRAGPSPGPDAILDIAALVEVDASNVLTLNGGRWKVGATLESANAEAGTDATHIYKTGSLLNTEYNVIVAKGQTKTITSRSTNYYNTSAFSPAPTTGDPYTLVQAPTLDGIHPARYAHELMAPSLTFAWVKEL